MRLPAWHWAFVVFRIGDGLTWALIPVYAITGYGLPIWGPALVAAAMNLASVPASVLWARMLQDGVGRRRAATAGFAVSALAVAAMATHPPFWMYTVAATVFMAAGVATAPAASVLVLEGQPRREWGAATGELARRTGYALLAGTVLAIVFGFAGILDVLLVFAAVAVLSAGAAVAAWITIQRAERPAPLAPATRSEEVRATQRRFERWAFHPGKVRFPADIGALGRRLQRPEAPILIGVFLLFAGTLLFLGGFPGVMRDALGFPVSWILLAQAPSFVVSSLAFAQAGRFGDTFGEGRGLRIAAMLRAVAVPGMCLAVLVGGSASASLVWLLVFNGVLGVSFAFLQVNGPVLLADLSSGRRAHGIGAFHAAVALGIMVGSLLSFLLLASTPLAATYAVATGTVLAGGFALVLSLPRAVVQAMEAKAAATA